jgi:pimeloyl-ACP methyl ester carboxylesterase
LDYDNVTAGTTHIAIIRLPAKNASAEDLLVNPGGPGGSAVSTVRSSYWDVQDKVGTQYNLIGIDPRGVSNSGPDISCFPGYPAAGRNAFYAEVFAIPDDTSAYGLQKNFQAVGAYGDWCTSIYNVNDTAKYIGTVAVAQDMIRYIELAAEDRGREPSEAKLNYYGLSYGTVLGATFASLYPKRIHRMLLDGVVDSVDYYAGGWKTAPYDTDKAVRTFFEDCLEAGPICVFRGNATSWEQLQERYTAIMDSLKRTPLYAADPFSNFATALHLIPAVFTWQDLIWRTMSYMYSPGLTFLTLAQLLVDLEVGNAMGLWPGNNAARIVSPVDDVAYDQREAEALISCLDANGRFNTSTIGQYTEHVEFMANRSRYGGLAVVSTVGPICRNLRVSPPTSQTFEGSRIPPRSSTRIELTHCRFQDRQQQD